MFTSHPSACFLTSLSFTCFVTPFFPFFSMYYRAQHKSELIKGEDNTVCTIVLKPLFYQHFLLIFSALTPR